MIFAAGFIPLNMTYETVIGLEIHVQLNTESKAFCADANTFQQEPNTRVSPISLAHPGTLPKANHDHIYKALKLGIALGSVINTFQYFDRKNYTYPDLPKSYQITQDKKPIAIGGKVTYRSESSLKSIRLHHIHMEEDAGKSIHDLSDKATYIDLNRAGVPLVEIVTEPDFRSGQEVHDFLAEMQRIVQYLGISNGNMEEGSFRCDCNVSVRPTGEAQYGERCEIKNLNSKRFARMAVEVEAERQIQIIHSGLKIARTTLLFDSINNETTPMREKESQNDYRYFPEPDLAPIHISENMINTISAAETTLPLDIENKLIDVGIPSDHAALLTSQKEIYAYFASIASTQDNFLEIVQLFIQKIIPLWRLHSGNIQKKTQAEIADFIKTYQNGHVPKAIMYQRVFDLWWQGQASAEEVARKLDLLISDDQSFIDDLIDQVIHENPQKIDAYLKGKKGLLGFFVGQVVQASKGKANPKIVHDKWIKHLLSYDHKK